MAICRRCLQILVVNVERNRVGDVRPELREYVIESFRRRTRGMDANDDEATVLVKITPAPDVRGVLRQLMGQVRNRSARCAFDTVRHHSSGTSFFGSAIDQRLFDT